MRVFDEISNANRQYNGDDYGDAYPKYGANGDDVHKVSSLKVCRKGIIATVLRPGYQTTRTGGFIVPALHRIYTHKPPTS